MPARTASPTESHRKRSLPGTRPVGLFVVALLSAAVLGWAALDQIQVRVRDNLRGTLFGILQSAGKGVHNWALERREDARTWARNPRLHRLIHAQLTVPRNPEALAASTAIGDLRAELAPFLGDHGYQGAFVIARDHLNVASMRDANLGVPNLLVDHGGYLPRIFRGETLVTRPLRSDVPLTDLHGRLAEGEPTMFVGAPIYDQPGGAVPAALALRIHVAEFTRITQLARFGSSGETYAFDEAGLLLTESRFDAQLQAMNLVPPGRRGILSVLVRDPGRDLRTGPAVAPHHEGLPFTRLVDAVLSRRPPRTEPIVVTEGYRDYRGVPVVGAGFWDERLGFGIVTEIDFDEAYSAYAAIFWIVTLVLAGTVVMFSVLVVKIERLRERALDASPLTGLPGNHDVSRRISKAIRERLAEVVVYCDLDGFKAYNDRYGFSAGDDVLRFTGKTIEGAVRRVSGPRGFVGHVGGDDFVFVVPAEHAEQVAAVVKGQFDEGVRRFFSVEDLERGGIVAEDRRGVERLFPIVALSMAGVDLTRRSFEHALDVAGVCAEVKIAAKSHAGSVFVMDRRSA